MIITGGLGFVTSNNSTKPSQGIRLGVSTNHLHSPKKKKPTDINSRHNLQGQALPYRSLKNFLSSDISSSIIKFQLEHATMSDRFEQDPKVAKIYADNIVKEILPRYPVMEKDDVYDAMQTSSPLSRLLWCLGEVMWYLSEFKQQRRIWPAADRAAAAVQQTETQTQTPYIVLMAELLYAIFGIYGRCQDCVTDGMACACSTLSKIPNKNKIAKYNSLVETLARIQM